MRIQSFTLENGIFEFKTVEKKLPICPRVLKVVKEYLKSSPEKYTKITATIDMKDEENPEKIRILGGWNTDEKSKSIISVLDEKKGNPTYFVEGKIENKDYYDFFLNKTDEKITILIATILDNNVFSQINCYEVQLMYSEE